MTTITNAVRDGLGLAPDADMSALVARHGLAGFPPRLALQIVTGNPSAGNEVHAGRDVATLRRLGITSIKVAGRWVVPAWQVAAWARGDLKPVRIDRRRRECRHARKASPTTMASTVSPTDGSV